MRGKATEFVVDQRQQMFGGSGIALLSRFEDAAASLTLADDNREDTTTQMPFAAQSKVNSRTSGMTAIRHTGSIPFTRSMKTTDLNQCNGRKVDFRERSGNLN